jgi:hypothetical protein
LNILFVGHHEKEAAWLGGHSLQAIIFLAGSKSVKCKSGRCRLRNCPIIS